MEKAPDAFRTISEVADDLDLPQHVLRFWETRFQQIKPMKRGGGRRYYRPDDIDLLRGIRHLLYGEGYTIRGAQRILKDHGVKFVQNVWRPVRRSPRARPKSPEAEVVEAPPARPSPPGARRGETDPAHRRLFGLLPSFLSSGPGRGASRREPRAPIPRPQSRRRRLAPRRTKSSAPALPPEGLRKLQDTLRELQECRKLLDAASLADDVAVLAASAAARNSQSRLDRAGRNATRALRHDTDDTNSLRRDTPTIQRGPTMQAGSVNGNDRRNRPAAGRTMHRLSESGGRAAGARRDGTRRRRTRSATRSRWSRSITASTTGISPATRSTTRRCCAPSSAWPRTRC